MMHPMRVEWTTPDEAKRSAAAAQIERDAADWQRGIRSGTRYPYRALVAARGTEERSDVLARAYPDLHAEIVHYGTLLEVRYVPEQWGVRTFARGGLDLGTTGSGPIKLCASKWVALVATEDGTREMDPTKLRVMWPMSAGDPIGGVVTGDELRRTLEAQQAHVTAALDELARRGRSG